MTVKQRQAFIKAAKTALKVVLIRGTDEEIIALLHDLTKRVHTVEERQEAVGWGAALMNYANGEDAGEEEEDEAELVTAPLRSLKGGIHPCQP